MACGATQLCHTWNDPSFKKDWASWWSVQHFGRDLRAGRKDTHEIQWTQPLQRHWIAQNVQEQKGESGTEAAGQRNARHNAFPEERACAGKGWLCEWHFHYLKKWNGTGFLCVVVSTVCQHCSNVVNLFSHLWQTHWHSRCVTNIALSVRVTVTAALPSDGDWSSVARSPLLFLCCLLSLRLRFHFAMIFRYLISRTWSKPTTFFQSQCKFSTEPFPNNTVRTIFTLYR